MPGLARRRACACARCRCGGGALAANDHDESPFTVAGVLQRTGTPVDRSVYIPLDRLLTPGLPDADGWLLLGAIVAGGAVASLVPALRACRLSLADGLIPRS